MFSLPVRHRVVSTQEFFDECGLQKIELERFESPTLLLDGSLTDLQKEYFNLNRVISIKKINFVLRGAVTVNDIRHIIDCNAYKHIIIETELSDDALKFLRTLPETACIDINLDCISNDSYLGKLHGLHCSYNQKAQIEEETGALMFFSQNPGAKLPVLLSFLPSDIRFFILQNHGKNDEVDTYWKRDILTHQWAQVERFTPTTRP